MSKVKPIPEGYHTVTPYLIVKGAARALELYKKAFGATELFRMTQPDGRIGHAEIKIGDSPIMLADEFPEIGAQPAVVWRVTGEHPSLRRGRGPGVRSGDCCRGERAAAGRGPILR